MDKPPSSSARKRECMTAKLQGQDEIIVEVPVERVWPLIADSTLSLIGVRRSGKSRSLVNRTSRRASALLVV